MQFVNIIHDKLYEKVWLILCEQLELGDKNLKTVSNFFKSSKTKLSFKKIRFLFFFNQFKYNRKRLLTILYYQY